MRRRQQIARIGEAIGGRLGGGGGLGIDPELGQIARVQCLLDSDCLAGRLGKPAHRSGIWRLGGGNRQHAGVLGEIDARPA